MYCVTWLIHYKLVSYSLFFTTYSFITIILDPWISIQVPLEQMPCHCQIRLVPLLNQLLSIPTIFSLLYQVSFSVYNYFTYYLKKQKDVCFIIGLCLCFYWFCADCKLIYRLIYRISANSCRDNYSRETTIQRRKLLISFFLGGVQCTYVTWIVVALCM